MSRERIAKLVLMLSSPNDGEVVNAARAIGKALAAAKLDWHTLASWVAAPSSPVPAPQADSPYREDINPSSYMTPEDLTRLETIWNVHQADLNEKERGFVKQLVTACRIYGRNKVFMTTRQRIWLRSIHGKYTS